MSAAEQPHPAVTTSALRRWLPLLVIAAEGRGAEVAASLAELAGFES